MAEIQQASMAARSPTAVGSPEAILADAADQINLTQAAIDSTLLEMKKGMPEHSEYERLMTERKLKAQQVLDLSKTLAEFEMLIKSQKDPVTIEDEPTEPTMPIKPRRSVFIGGCVVLALAMGLGLVCFLEHIDHSVKVPEHLTAGLTLPLFGVVPRIRRGARNHRGGHLWTPGIPDSIEADAYRNLRASLLGVTQHRGPIVTLLVTSAKAGEGKSTTALNLAATCARAGERTLLMDVDLRRPSLGDVFPGDGKGTGLVDILRGELPWQRTVVQTDLPNLDFLPTGDTRDVPIEVLGSLELRQLLISLSQNHYDRVILDGPAVLGLADCRMLGRIVDAAVMVVRSGSQELRPLQRAKAMLEQSQVYIAGLIFNGLREDMENWSSYGPNPAEFALFEASGSRAGGVARGLEAPSRPGPALMAAGSVDA
jgi:capsular exopolysaccharide synthesis family protein